MEEVRGTFWCRVTDKSPWWNRGLMTRDEALAAAAEALAPHTKGNPNKWGQKGNPNGGYSEVTVTTPSTDPPNKLPTKVLTADKDGLCGPWAPTSEADPVIVGTLNFGPKSIDSIASQLEAAGHPGGRMNRKTLRSHLRRLGCKRLPKDRNHSTERWAK